LEQGLFDSNFVGEKLGPMIFYFQHIKKTWNWWLLTKSNSHPTLVNTYLAK